ncbi:hypothetical protein GCM10011383_37400 [Hymenobacter cavernae]|uniref:DUF4349 domain-containing protein n=1 Tax=Hymenobacter cavernae TaxID=2044852 RepID=A0ABQ1ULX0_9BACT|nr:hypothetical protein GCM10011383_37400 [Hymenobacter cavernae]
MKLHLLACALLLGATSCAVLQRPTPEQKVAKFLTEHPNILSKETIRVEVPVRIPQIEFRTQYIPVRNVIREQRDSVQLDSLLHQVEISLDSVQRAAARHKVLQWVESRPTLQDTLCFDTLGVSGRVWRTGNAYQLWVVRKDIETKASTAVVATKLKPCPRLLVYAWYEVEGWPWWLLLLCGAIVGAGLTYFIFSLAIRAAR